MKKYQLAICVFLLMIVFFFFWKKETETKINLFYFDTYIEVKFSTNKSSREIEKIKEEITNLYQTYHELANRYEEYGNNVYYLIHNDFKGDTITVDPRLYELLEYSNEWIQKSNGKLNINMGCVIDIWRQHMSQNDIPMTQEFDGCESNTLELLGDNKVKNNHPNIDLGAIAKGYTTQKVGEYLKQEGISHYLINAGGNVLAGDVSGKSAYQIGIQNPNDNTVFKVLNIKEKAIVTSGGYERFYLYDGKKYHHIIDPETNFPGEYMKSVTVITEDSGLADALSTTLFLMPVEVGKAYLEENYKEVDAIWYTNDDEIIETEGIKNYE